MKFPTHFIDWCRLGFGCLVVPLAAATAAPKDVFLLLGQSNMAGRGALEAEDRQPQPGIFVLNKELAWAPAAEPLHFDKPGMAAVGPGFAFAKAVKAARPDAEIGLVPCAMGGSSLGEWKPGGVLFTQAVARARAALKDGATLRAILWHQGESDSGNPALAASYAERWSVMMKALREELGAESVPVLVGELGGFLSAGKAASVAHAGTVNAQLATLAAAGQGVWLVRSEGLVDKGDGLHFDAPSARELGRRYAEVYLSIR